MVLHCLFLGQVLAFYQQCSAGDCLSSALYEWAVAHWKKRAGRTLTSVHWPLPKSETQLKGHFCHRQGSCHPIQWAFLRLKNVTHPLNLLHLSRHLLYRVHCSQYFLHLIHLILSHYLMNFINNTWSEIWSVSDINMSWKTCFWSWPHFSFFHHTLFLILSINGCNIYFFFKFKFKWKKSIICLLIFHSKWAV